MKILEKRVLAEEGDVRIVLMGISAPDIASRVKPGQFVVVMVAEEGERIPLTVVDRDEDKGTITLIVQEVGLTTRLLGKLDIGDSLYALVGPMGHSTEIKKYGKVILVGGGVGIAEIFPAAKALKGRSPEPGEGENHLTVILGARTKNLLFLEEELKGMADEFYVTTDDGSRGRKGFTTDCLGELIAKDKYDLVYAVGPIPMMEKVSQVTKDSGVKTVVSLNALMVDASGMCGGCRVTVGGEVRFTCVDGPEFDAHLVDWNELKKRNTIYEDKEKEICKLYLKS